MAYKTIPPPLHAHNLINLCRPSYFLLHFPSAKQTWTYAHIVPFQSRLSLSFPGEKDGNNTIYFDLEVTGKCLRLPGPPVFQCFENMFHSYSFADTSTLKVAKSAKEMSNYLQ